MSRRILTFATLIAVAIHVLLGCCGHHDHPTSLGSGESATPSGGCSCHRSSSEPESTDSQQRPGESSCDEAECDFYVSNSAGPGLSVALAYWLPPVEGEAELATLAAVQRSCGEAQIPELPQPLHALMQVWLI